jgi:hypothetical protein
MASNWIRGKAERPAKRRIVLIYETGDAKNDDLEQLVDHIPYGQGNRVYLECLRAGAKAMISQLNGGKGVSAPPIADTKVTPELVNTSSSSNGQTYSKAATRMFETGAN